MGASIKLKTSVLVLGLSLAMQAHAAGLGSMNSSSKLGEPLKAEIELLAVNPSDLGSLRAALASEQIYQEQQLEKPASYASIQIEVTKNAQGVPVLRLSSTQPITEAFLDMLIQVDWPAGRLIKEYTLLLDPPGYESNTVSESNTLPVAAAAALVQPETPAAEIPRKAEVASTATAPSSKPPVAQPATAATNAAPDSNAASAENEAGITVEKGDTLSQIARQLKPDAVSLEQMLAGLYQANPAAFSGDNMHRLKAGAVLKIPQQEALSALSQQQAQALVSAQTKQWNAYKNTLAGVVQQSASTKEKAVAQQSSGKLSPAQSNPPAASPANKDVLKLSAGDEKARQSQITAAGKASQDKLNALQEDLTAKDNAIKEERSRTAALERQVEDMKKLLALKNDAMAQLKANSQEKSEAEKSTGVSSEAAAAKTDAAPAESDKTAETPVSTPEQAAENAQAGVSFVSKLRDRLQHSSPLLPWALAGLTLLGLGWFGLRQRKKQQIQDFEEAIVTTPSNSLNAPTVFGQTQSATVSDTSFLTDFSQTPVGGVLDAQDVDPIAEAEVYMAYGRHAQAEEILKDAIVKDGQRQALKLKLLEIYQQTENMTAFESLASDVYQQWGPQDASWQKVAQWGNQLDPKNPLYRAAVTTTPAPTVFEVEDSADAAAETFTADSSTTATEQVISATEQPSALNFTPAKDDADDARTDSAEASLNESEPTSAATPGSAVAETTVLTPKPVALPSLDFEPEALSNDAMAQPLPNTTPAALAKEDAVFEQIPDLNFDLGNDTLNPGFSMQELPADSAAADFELETPASADETRNEEVEAKLDLIKAYIEMEDIVGAKELIEEVLREGTIAQRQRADTLRALIP